MTSSDKRPDTMQEQLVRLERALDLALERNSDLETQTNLHRSELDGLSAELRERQTTIDALEAELIQLRSDLSVASSRLKEIDTRAERIADTKARHIAALERKLASTKASPTYQLGHAISAATKSWAGLLALPGRLLSVHAEGRRRDQLRKNKKPT